MTYTTRATSKEASVHTEITPVLERGRRRYGLLCKLEGLVLTARRLGTSSGRSRITSVRALKQNPSSELLMPWSRPGRKLQGCRWVLHPRPGLSSI